MPVEMQSRRASRVARRRTKTVVANLSYARLKANERKGAV